MPMVRISFVKPNPGQHDAVVKILDELEDFLSSRPSYIMGCRLANASDPDHIGRMAMWADQESVNHAAVLDHLQVVRGRLHQIIQPGHQELLFEVQGTPKNLPS